MSKQPSGESSATGAAEIVDRKRSHFDLCAQQEVEFRAKTTWLEEVELVHQPLTETRLEEIDLGVTVLGKRLDFPLMITGMTGGADEVRQFNRDIAALADRMRIGFGVGSQRVMLRYPASKASFDVREVAPDVLLFGNIGIAQARELTTAEAAGLGQAIGADGLCVHLNTAMEIIQADGDHDFRGSFEALKRLAGESPLPIIAKETGCGFARESGARLVEAGIEWVDVAGAGGTSWVGVETLRNRALRHLGEAFWDWGVPTAASLCELRGLPLQLIASGGIRTGMQAAHALALGARIVGVALPVLRAYVAGGVDAVELYLRRLCDEIRVALMLAGCARVRDLTPRHAVLHGRLLDWTRQRGMSEQ
ncbi:MAG: type 2 isopentenyl-diphosphate Delta-isomerase [Blastocatellia bacterium]|nr:type 2 isopentenyl-diphosphate Delta-isomerase [Blastocatellia bacterium]